jgi:hypothetical protein
MDEARALLNLISHVVGHGEKGASVPRDKWISAKSDNWGDTATRPPMQKMLSHNVPSFVMFDHESTSLKQKK